MILRQKYFRRSEAENHSAIQLFCRIDLSKKDA